MPSIKRTLQSSNTHSQRKSDYSVQRIVTSTNNLTASKPYVVRLSASFEKQVLVFTFVYITIYFPCSVTCLQCDAWKCFFCCVIVVVFGSILDAATRRVPRQYFCNCQITLTLQTPNAYYNFTDFAALMQAKVESTSVYRHKGRKQLIFSGEGANWFNLLYITNKYV